jgi:hypothetical protein
METEIGSAEGSVFVGEDIDWQSLGTLFSLPPRGGGWPALGF